MNIILLEPEIPQNTGNIGRSCAATGTRLHLIGPLGFRLGEREIRRAGLDYWEKLDVTVYSGWSDFKEQHPDVRPWMATTKARRVYSDVSYQPDDWIMFGKESAGIPEELLKADEERCVRIPMLEWTRSLNLSSSAAVLLFEALRQNGFPGLQRAGELHRLSWED